MINKNWFRREHYKKVFGFLGPGSVLLLVVGAAVGVILFGIELTFAYTLQAFLTVLGAIPLQNLKIPNWIPCTHLLTVLSFILAVAAIRGFFQWAQIYMQGVALEGFKLKQRSRLLNWVFKSQSASGTQVTNLFGEWTNAAGTVVMNLQNMASQLTTAVFLGVTLFWLAPVITLVSAVVLTVLFIPLRAIGKKDQAAGVGLLNEWHRTNNRLIMSIKNLLLLRIYGRENAEEALAQKSLSGYYRHVINHYKLSGILFSVPPMAGVLLICGISYFAQERHQLSSGILISYFYLFVRLVQNFSTVASSVSSVIFLWPQLDELAKWWNNHAEDGLKNSQNKISSKLQSKIFGISEPVGWRLTQVEFQYPGAISPVCSNINFEIRPGSAVVITGPSGAGKSTLINLLLGELDATSGQITIAIGGNYHLLEEVKAELLKKVGYVGAESFLIEGTIYENLLYGLTQPPDHAEIQDAILRSECQFIHELKDGLQHPLTEQGQGLSAGQKQRLSLARSLLRKPLALFLDEATANLDYETEKKLVKTFATLKGQMTIIAVSHRQELLTIADQTLKIEQYPISHKSI